MRKIFQNIASKIAGFFKNQQNQGRTPPLKVIELFNEAQESRQMVTVRRERCSKYSWHIGEKQKIQVDETTHQRRESCATQSCLAWSEENKKGGLGAIYALNISISVPGQ